MRSGTRPPRHDQNIFYNKCYLLRFHIALLKYQYKLYLTHYLDPWSPNIFVFNYIIFSFLDLLKFYIIFFFMVLFTLQPIII